MSPKVCNATVFLQPVTNVPVVCVTSPSLFLVAQGASVLPVDEQDSDELNCPAEKFWCAKPLILP